jgi:hypothetical protein
MFVRDDGYSLFVCATTCNKQHTTHQTYLLLIMALILITQLTYSVYIVCTVHAITFIRMQFCFG